MDAADRAQATLDRAASAWHPPRRPLARVLTICTDCQDEIEPARLKAMPYALRCSECQSDFERIERLHGGHV